MGTPSISRPQKVGNVTTYVDEVNYLAPADAPILAPEVDADFATLYNAWNNPASAFPPTDGSVTTAKLVDGNVTRAKHAADCWLPPVPGAGDVGSVLVVTSGPAIAWQPTPGGPWGVSGGTITPTDPTKIVVIPGPTAGAEVLRFGNRTIKGRLIAQSNADVTYLTANANLSAAGAWVQDDSSRPSWMASCVPATDSFIVQRLPAGNPGASANLLAVNSGGTLTATGDVVSNSGWVYLGTNGLVNSGNGPIAQLIANQSQNVPSRPTWIIQVDCGTSDNVNILRQAPNGGAWAVPFSLTGANNLSIAGGITAASLTATGSATRVSGIRYSQGGGSLAGDGFSNQVGLGWQGSQFTIAVDNVYKGTINITASDERMKMDVREDVPGLDVVLAMRPISYAFRPEWMPPLEDGTRSASPRQYGMIAQEVQPLAPLAIHEDGTENRWLSLDYPMLVPILINALKELATRLATLEARAA